MMSYFALEGTGEGTCRAGRVLYTNCLSVHRTRIIFTGTVQTSREYFVWRETSKKIK